MLESLPDFAKIENLRIHGNNLRTSLHKGQEELRSPCNSILVQQSLKHADQRIVVLGRTHVLDVIGCEADRQSEDPVLRVAYAGVATPPNAESRFLLVARIVGCEPPQPKCVNDINVWAPIRRGFCVSVALPEKNCTISTAYMNCRQMSNMG